MTTDINLNNTVRTLNGLLPTLTPSAARLTRLIASTGFTQSLARQVQAHHLQILGPSRPDPSSPWGSLSVQHPTGQAQISFDLAPWPALQMLAADSTSNNEDSALNAAVLEIFLSRAAQHLQNLGLEDVSFRNLTLLSQDKKSAGAYQEQITLSFKLPNQMQNEPFVLTIDQIDSSLLNQLEALSMNEPVSLDRRFAQLKLPGRALLGIQRLQIDTLYSLQEGDILLNGIAPHYRSLLDDSAALDNIELMWGTPKAKRLRSTGRLDGQMIVIKDTPVISEDIDTEETTDSISDEEELDNLAQLEVPVRLEVDTIMLPLAELSGLNTGYVIELPIPLSQASIRLTIHGQTIGFGELVAVGEHLAVRIKKMAPIDDSTH